MQRRAKLVARSFGRDTQLEGHPITFFTRIYLFRMASRYMVSRGQSVNPELWSRETSQVLLHSQDISVYSLNCLRIYIEDREVSSKAECLKESC